MTSPDEAAGCRRDLRAIGFLAILVLSTCLPFVHRAYFVDDYYHMEMAKGILEHPLRPYDFRTDDNGRVTHRSHRRTVCER